LIVELVTENVHADRSTLYLMDEQERVIWSKVLQGEEWLEIRLPLGTGLAGYVAQTGETVNIEDAYQDPRFYKNVDEQTGYVTKSVLCAPMRNRDGKIIGVFQVLNKKEGLFTHEDETFLEAMSSHAALAVENAFLYKDALEHHKVERQVLRAQKMEAMGRLAGGVAHDFNNLLTLISGYSELLMADMDEDDPRHKEGESIRTAADRAATLTRQLLAFSRKQELKLEPLNLNDTITGIDSMLRRVAGEDVTLVTELKPNLDSVKTDAGQMEQVVMNLVTNARDAMPEGGTLTIRTTNVTVEPEEADERPGLKAGPYVLLGVTDTGVGMDHDTLSHIFEPFFTTKERGEGTGLGLATIYGIVKQSGGDVSVDSRPGRGTTFEVYLPRHHETS
ncbi:MAG: ATP-binding protein, partial [Fidelibacterota bacterium]